MARFLRNVLLPALFGLASTEGVRGQQTPVPSATNFPPYRQMELGQALFWTIQAEQGNIAYKGIAIRVDPGPGGVSKGRAWMLYDHDTMRVAAAWTGSEFIDWKGVAFDGGHSTHASIVGDRAFGNPPGPGWGQPETGNFEDLRLVGKDGKRYGPLPREWAHYCGLYLRGDKVVLSYQIGDCNILEQPGFEQTGDEKVFTRTIEAGPALRDLVMRIAPTNVPVALARGSQGRLEARDGFSVLIIPARTTRQTSVVLIAAGSRLPSAGALEIRPDAGNLSEHTQGGPPRWTKTLATQAKRGGDAGPFAVDEIVAPTGTDNPWRSWMRFGGFDFYPDGQRAAICAWNGDVWLVDGLGGDLLATRWKRIAAGLFQPLGLKIVDNQIYVSCRDQIARLRDLNGDEEIDFIENFNNDHQVTEHFHEFAMGLQTDAAGNFYYAKSARHALPPLVPHHGTLLKVSQDGRSTEIVASGFRAANGVCVNDDGSFFVTDQEGHWHPKNRINWVRPGRFYGNMWAYHHPESSADSAMDPPVVWITNEMDRSPGELIRVTSPNWGPLRGSLLNISYGMGRIFLVLTERTGDQMQGGVVQLPLPDFPTGIMRARFHPRSGDLYVCGLFGWAGNRTRDGGFFRIRATGKPMRLPVGLEATTGGMRIHFSDPVDKNVAADPGNYAVKTWSLNRSEKYGSPHLNEKTVAVSAAIVGPDAKSVLLQISDLRPTWCMEIKYSIDALDGTVLEHRIHNTIHAPRPADSR